MSCDLWAAGDLEAYAFGELRGKAARRVEAHLFGCAGCAAELRRLRAEQRLFRDRAAAETSDVPGFEGVLARIGSPAAAAPPAVPRRNQQGGALRAVGSGARGVVSAAVAVVALAAAVAGVRVNRRPAAIVAPVRPAQEAVEITAEAVCSSDAPFSMYPAASLAPAAPSATPGNFSREPEEPRQEEPGACSTGHAGEVCAPEAAMTYSCGDAASLCGDQL